MNQINKRLKSIALLVFALAVVIVLFFSCVSFDIGDFPSRYVWPNNNPTANWCGAVGAFAAYYLMYYVGPGIFVLLAAFTTAIIWRLCNKELSQIILRTVGLTLVTIAVSSIIYMLWPHPAGSFPIGSGGALGSGATLFLKQNFSLLGSVIIAASSFLVGAILLADSLVIRTLHILGVCFMRAFGFFADILLMTCG